MSNSNVEVIEKYKKGRPEVKNINKRNKLIKLYVTEEEKQWFIKHQEKAGYKQLSRFIYEETSRLIRDGKFSYETHVEINRELQSSIRGIANNVNQAIAYTHSTHNVKHLIAFRAELINALEELNKVQKEISNHKEVTRVTFPEQLALIEYLLSNKAAYELSWQ